MYNLPMRVRPAIAIRPRDAEILRGLFESRMMSSAHVAELYFGGRREAAKKRLQALKREGLVRELPRKPSEPASLFVSERGIAALRAGGHLGALRPRSPRVSELTARHELAVMDVKAAVARAARGATGLSIAEFSTSPREHKFRTVGPDRRAVLLKPDGFVRLRRALPGGRREEHAFFVEVDRSTETLSTLAAKAHGYLAHYRSGGFAAQRGGPRAEYRRHPFRVLMVFRSPERRDGVAAALLRCYPPVLKLTWLATSEDVLRDPLGPIWLRPLDVRAVGATVQPNLRPLFDA